MSKKYIFRVKIADPSSTLNQVEMDNETEDQKPVSDNSGNDIDLSFDNDMPSSSSDISDPITTSIEPEQTPQEKLDEEAKQAIVLEVKHIKATNPDVSVDEVRELLYSGGWEESRLFELFDGVKDNFDGVAEMIKTASFSKQRLHRISRLKKV